ncbi:saccharopine dehydrogenase [Halieaceae bacterium IMCC14734]|uniref:Saccharopine dehydrogenase n=1 Tax=Candidatus Litorirhabdus singularis TaxID=2518993 RepID=A0ABT3TI24_9GAMM|nr:saccharopine dehydrogenase NADP-binding domain-containing protein [Candidatus Litorirhabdus singularis]MCX2981032.1 saccharopine dehydrogenase [Candidatus Litorirhabdus singularis]
MPVQEREYDIILLGASGFTGRLVAEYLLAQYGIGGDLRWAMAGRNEAKLESIRLQLQGYEPAAPIPILVADTSDASAMAGLASQTRVICTTVGPYALYGSSVVEACAHNGTHYCDLTGEVQWMRRMIDAHQAAAAASGARIVHTCGFDSIPSDLGVLFAQNTMQEAHGVAARRVKYRVTGFGGGLSGGTLASMLNMMEEVKQDPGLADVMADPYALNPQGAPTGSDVNDQTGAIYDEDFASWTLPFMMAGINTRVVRRSNALLDFAWGEDFNYDEAVLAEGKGALQSKITALAMTAGTNALSIGPLRGLASRFMPKPGEGPDQETREQGYYNILLHANHPDDMEKDIRVKVSGDMDPGYGSTSKMLAECAVCLARDNLTVSGGFWTPASAMGTRLIERLQQNAGVSFTVE